MSERAVRADELRQEALAAAHEERFDDALRLFDEARALAEDEELIELITINKADALIAMGRSGPEVQALPRILMVRRNPHHTFIAAYALMYRHRLAGEMKRAIFYGQIALDAARTADQSFWKIAALNDLGIAYEIDSQFEKAIDAYETALSLIDAVSDDAQQNFSRTAIYGNLGYTRMLVGEIHRGIAMLESILDQIVSKADLSDAYIELCFGYVELQQYAKARELGERGLELAANERQVRNAHYLLGEAAYKMDDVEGAEVHFDELARFYPQFRQLKNVLFSIDLRSMINLRL